MLFPCCNLCYQGQAVGVALLSLVFSLLYSVRRNLQDCSVSVDSWFLIHSFGCRGSRSSRDPRHHNPSRLRRLRDSLLPRYTTTTTDRPHNHELTIKQKHSYLFSYYNRWMSTIFIYHAIYMVLFLMSKHINTDLTQMSVCTVLKGTQDPSAQVNSGQTRLLFPSLGGAAEGLTWSREREHIIYYNKYHSSHSRTVVRLWFISKWIERTNDSMGFSEREPFTSFLIESINEWLIH